jgi:hypothetical protein
MGLSSFQLLQAFEMGQERPPIFFYVFDLLQLNGEDEERKAKLEKLLKKPPGIIRYSASIENGGEELLDRARELGLEGLIGKRVGSRYEAAKRSGACRPGGRLTFWIVSSLGDFCLELHSEKTKKQTVLAVSSFFPTSLTPKGRHII